MIKRLLHIVSLSMVFCLLFTGCSAAGTEGGSSTGEAQNTVSVQENTTIPGLPEEGEAAVPAYTYKTQEIWVQNGDQIVVFYGSNSWAHTRLGQISDKSAGEMAELLSKGDVTITIGKR